VNAPKPQGELVDADDTSVMETVLSERHQLPREAARRIRDLMKRQGVSFTEAAMQLGYMRDDGSIVTQDDHVITESQGSGDGGAGLVEAAMRRVAAGRQLVLRQGEEVTPGPQLAHALDPNNSRSEKIRVLRTELLLLNESQKTANMVALISPDAGEGRSLLSAELAISFAQLGRRTLLVDADMRRPRQHVLFGSNNEHGLSTALSQNSRPYLHPVAGLPGLFLCTAGSIPSNPLELLSDGRFAKLMTEWRAAYEFIVIDTPPVTQSADALAVATVAGRVLLASRTQHSSYKSTRELMKRLATTQAKVLGAVMSDF
jgi:receptor protein-tyrosine kinase